MGVAPQSASSRWANCSSASNRTGGSSTCRTRVPVRPRLHRRWRERERQGGEGGNLLGGTSIRDLAAHSTAPDRLQPSLVPCYGFQRDAGRHSFLPKKEKR